MLTWYQSESPSHETVLAGQEDLEGLLFPERLSHLELAVPPEINSTAERLQMHFCSVFITQDPADRIYRVNLNDWEVSWQIGTDLSWSCAPLERGLMSPRYSPQI
jgi:hypothetical protein